MRIELFLTFCFFLTGCLSIPTPESANTSIPATSTPSPNTSESPEKRVSHFLSIAEDGKRYMFRSNDGNLMPIIIKQHTFSNGAKFWCVFIVNRTDQNNNIIDANLLQSTVFSDNFYTERYDYLTIRHINNNIWRISRSAAGMDEYATMIEAPEGFWSEAYIDATV